MAEVRSRDQTESSRVIEALQAENMRLRGDLARAVLENQRIPGGPSAQAGDGSSEHDRPGTACDLFGQLARTRSPDARTLTINRSWIFITAPSATNPMDQAYIRHHLTTGEAGTLWLEDERIEAALIYDSGYVVCVPDSSANGDQPARS